MGYQITSATILLIHLKKKFKHVYSAVHILDYHIYRICQYGFYDESGKVEILMIFQQKQIHWRRTFQYAREDGKKWQNVDIPQNEQHQHGRNSGNRINIL